MANEDFTQLLGTMRSAAAALREAGIPFALGGGLAVWARGGPRTEHDVDFFVREEDAKAAQRVLADAGMRPVDPPEGWLLKAYDGDTLVDLIHAPRGGPVDDSWFERAEELDVAAVTMPVASLEDVLVTKLLALNEQELDYSSVLETARAVREQLDWVAVRERAGESPYAQAFFTLVESLDIAPSIAAVDESDRM